MSQVALSPHAAFPYGTHGPTRRPARWRRAVFAYVGALGAIVLALVARVLLERAWGVTAPFPTFMLAVTIVAILGGLGPGLAATVASALAAIWLLPPRFVFYIEGTTDRVDLVVFVAVGVCVSLLSEYSHRARARIAVGEDFERSFRALLELSPDAVLLCDAERRVTEANAAACRLYGYGPAEFRGMRASDLVEPEEYARLLQEIPGVPGLTHLGETHVRRKDETFVPVEASTRVMPDGRFLASIRDISERKHAESEREELVSWLRAVLEQCPVGLALFHGAGGERVEINGRVREWLGVDFVAEPSLLEAFRRQARTLDGQPLPREQLPSLRALRGERVRSEFLCRTASGAYVHISVSAAPILGRDGRVLGAVVAAEDISAEKELERLRAEWSSVVAHDLRQPLGSILLYAQLLAQSPAGADVLKYTDRIRGAATRLTRMVGDLMDLSRLEASRLELVRQRVDVAALVRAAADLARLQSPERLFEVQVERTIPEVDADPDRITQVLENLLTNAVKYGKPATPVVVRVSRDGHDLAVSVTNEGRTLTPAEMDRIFERFQRTDSAKLQGIQGVGLGLYITRSLVEAHGGRIAAESIAGVTTFRFTLPARGT